MCVHRQIGKLGLTAAAIFRLSFTPRGGFLLFVLSPGSVCVGQAGTVRGNSNCPLCFSNPNLNCSDLKGCCLEYAMTAMVALQECDGWENCFWMEPWGHAMIHASVHLLYNTPGSLEQAQYPYCQTMRQSGSSYYELCNGFVLVSTSVSVTYAYVHWINF